MQIRHLFISPGHNYRGHHGKPPGEHPILEVDEVECVAGRGLVGDRFFDYKPEFKGQITFFAWEILQRLRAELGLAEATPAATRRNVITEGVDLNTLIGEEFELQGVRFAGTEECSPCYWMNRAFGNEETEEWLRGNGGLRARILTDGVLRRDNVAQASGLRCTG
jgi:MOSC domain-containing protein YiiM